MTAPNLRAIHCLSMSFQWWGKVLPTFESKRFQGPRAAQLNWGDSCESLLRGVRIAIVIWACLGVVAPYASKLEYQSSIRLSAQVQPLGRHALPLFPTSIADAASFGMMIHPYLHLLCFFVLIFCSFQHLTSKVRTAFLHTDQSGQHSRDPRLRSVTP